MTEEMKESKFSKKVSSVQEPKAAAPTPHEPSDKEVWLQIYCAAISAHVNSQAQARSIADRGLAEYKATHGG